MIHTRSSTSVSKWRMSRARAKTLHQLMSIQELSLNLKSSCIMARMFPSCDPCLPHYRSLLVQGDYHPSAPIHMCLSVPTGSRALLLSSSRKVLIHSIGEHNSEWLHINSGTGNTCRSSSKVDVLLVSILPCRCG